MTVARWRDPESGESLVPVGAEIEVIVRYHGHEYTITEGIVQMVDLERGTITYLGLDLELHEASDGTETVTITVRR